MDMSYFDYCQGLTMTSRKFAALFGGPPRRPETPLTQREMDLAASVQVVTEEIMMRASRHLHEQTGMKNLCLAGGVALNCVGNGKILRDGPFERIWIQPAAGDAGGALGVALFISGTSCSATSGGSSLDAARLAAQAALLQRARSRLPGRAQAQRLTTSTTSAHPPDRRPHRAGEGRRFAEAAWSSGRGRSARAASSATRAARRCSR
jgi:hypothetical protein